MFSSFGQATQNPSPGSNPFATKPSPFAQKPNPFATGNTNASNVTEQNGRGTHSDGEGKRKKAGGFRDDEAHLSDSGRSKKKRGDDGSKQNRDNGSKRHKDTRPRNATSNSHAEAVNTDASGIDSDDITTGTFQPTNDPRAIQVYTQLRKDGINPPNWPSQPGNPNNKVAMAKFRERYEQYRQKVRASLVKSGLIDDPSKRKNLSDAIDFKGICEDMCPEYEKITRITEIDVHQPEKDPNTGYAVNAHMVKKLARSAAGQEAPLPMDVRSAATLQRTMDYLIDDLLQDDDNLPGLHGFLWDRTRAIRRDFTFFSSLTPDELKAQVYVLENITRFHVTSLHLLSEEGNRPEDFVEQQELEQLGKALLSLRDLYDDCNGQGIQCENEPEFRAYYLIFHGSDPNIIEILQRQWRPSLWKDSDEIRTAVSLVEALQNTKDFHGPLKEAPSMSASAGYHTYFRIVEDSSVSYTMACFAECHFARLRRNLLESIARALARPKDAAKDVTAADLNRCLRFDTVDEAISFAELHDLSFQANEDHPEDPSRRRLLLSLGKQLPHHRLQHHFSEALVEAKRGSHSLPDVIHKTVFADGTVAKGNVFKADQNPQSSQQTSFKPAQGGSNTSISTVKPQGAFGGSTNNGVTAATNPFQSQAQPATSTQQPPPPATNPFSSGTTQAPGQFQKPATNPFASTSGPGTSTSPFTFGGNGNSSWKKPSSAEESTGQGSFTSKLSTDTGEKPFFGAASNGAKPEQPAEPEKPKPNPFTSQPPQLLAGTKPAPGAGGLLGQAPLPSAQPSGGLLQPKAPTFGFPSQAAPTTAPQSEQWSSQNAASSGSVLPSAKPFPSFPPSNTQPGTQGGSLNQANSSLDIQQAASLLPQPPQRTTTPSVSPPARLSQPVQGLPSAQVPVPPAVPTSPPRDRMADFTRWFVTGDNGLLDEFRTFMVENILSKVYDDYVRQQREEAQKEEEESLAAEAEAFRVYNTQLKFFYRWKRNARQKRMRFLRLQGREKQRQYYQSQREAEQRMSKEASLRKAKQRAELSLVDRPAEFSTMLTSSKKRSRTETEDALVASGVLDGMVDERRVARRIVSREYTPASERPSSGHSASHSTMTSASKKSGGKTAALREKFFGDKSVGFRKSMPSMSISSEPPHSRSRVSDRWRLKAMGIVKLPDGTAVPESMANDMMRRGRAFPGWSPGRKTSNPLSRRGSAASDVRPTVERSSSHSRAFAGSLLQKRKRPAHDEEGEEEGGGRGNRGEGPAKPHKRVVSEGGEELSETYRLIAELREMRGELEEGTQWFREQNDRMQSETRGSSRGHTPWDESVL